MLSTAPVDVHEMPVQAQGSVPARQFSSSWSPLSSEALKASSSAASSAEPVAAVGEAAAPGAIGMRAAAATRNQRVSEARRRDAAARHRCPEEPAIGAR